MTAKTRPAQPGRHTATGVRKPPYTWAGHTWVMPGSLVVPLIPPALLAALLAVFHAAGIYSPWWAFASLAIFAISGLSTAGERFAQTSLAYMWCMGAYWACWWGWSCFPYAWQGLGAIVGAAPPGQHHTAYVTITFYLVGLLATWCLWPSMRRNQIAFESKLYARALHGQPAAQLVASQAALDNEDTRSRGAQWVDMFARLDRPGLTFVTEVHNEAGVSVRLRLPVPGLDPHAKSVRMSSIFTEQLREDLETAMDIRSGAVRFERAKKEGTTQVSSRDFWVHIDYEDILAQIVRLPEITDDELMISISTAFPIGRMADGSWLYLTLREIHAMIVGATREGKSNLLHIIIHQVTRCYDAAIWMIDLKGGATARPWLMPWVKGKVARPILDWVAIDRWEAARILLACIDIATDRPLRRKGSKTEPQRTGMPMAVNDPTTGRPKKGVRDVVAVVLITDEIGELVGSAAGPTMAGKKEGFTSANLASLVTRFSCLAAGEAIYGLFAGQRSTADMFGNPSAQINIGLKVAVGKMNRQDAGMVFGQNSTDAVEMVQTLEHKGSIVAWQRGIERVLPTKVCFAGDEDESDAFCWNAAIRHDGIPASIETDRAACARAAEWGYLTRWTDRNRCGWLYLGDDVLDDEGGVPGWESVPLPLDAMNNPIPESQWADMQQRVADVRAREHGHPGGLSAGDVAVLEDAARRVQGLPPQTGPAAAPDARSSAELAAAGDTGFWPESDLAPAPTPGPIADDPKAVDAMLAGLASYLTNPAATPADDDEPEVPASMIKVLETTKIIDGYGRAGVTATELARDMIALGLITEKGKKAYRKLVLKAMEPGAVLDPDLRVEQPGGTGGRYFTHRHTTVSR